MKAKVLIVEDNADNRKLAGWILDDHGFAHESASSAEEALTMLDRGRFDLVLMDVSLPGMDGAQATRRLRSRPATANLPIIAVTAHAIKGEERSILESGVSALVTKPIDESLLIDTIRSFFPVEV